MIKTWNIEHVDGTRLQTLRTNDSKVVLAAAKEHAKVHGEFQVLSYRADLATGVR